jgi:serine phosphatase RsbU (regulator of sigma subunit)
VYSDGLLEVRNRNGRQLGVEGLIKVLNASRDVSLKQSLDAAFAAVTEWNSAPLADDLSIVGLEVR